MHTQSPGWRRLIVPIGFFLACIVVSILIWRAFGGATPLEPKSYRVTIPLADATSIYAQSDVEISGVHVGEVESVRRAGGRALVTVALESRFAPLRAEATATTRTKTLLGEGYVELAPGPRSAAAIPDGGRLAVGNVRAAQQLDQALETFAPATRRDIRRMFTGLATALHGRDEDLGDAVGWSGPAFTSFATVAEKVDRQGDAVQRLLSSGADVFSAVGERSGAVRAAVVSGDRLFGATARRDRSLSAMVRAFPPFLRQLRATSTVLEAAAVDLGPAIAASRPVAARLKPGLDAVDGAAPQFDLLFRRLPAVISASRKGLPAASAIARAIGRSSEQIHPAARELIPLLQLLAVDRDQLVAFFANVGQLSNVPYIGPGGKVLRGIGGIPSFWNETVAGWVKKLPTNRQNPYPKPRGALQIASGGLQAYDCRNTGNRLYLPPTGTGSPPCLTQGPWEFNGKSAYFPHLERAPR